MSLTPPVDGRTSGSLLGSDLHWLLSRLKQGLATAETAAVREHGMTLWGYTVLMGVVDAPTRSQLALSQVVSVDKSKLVIVLDELEAAGLVQRRPDPADRRARIVEATDAGRDALTAARRDVDAIESDLLAGLTPLARDSLRTVLLQLTGDPVVRITDGRPHVETCPPPRP
ncbi:MarR family winged helix-turn-helix transcriptional regulator [Streptomyces sp. NPDC087440]|uniref:MarR family winged helix-turn-helix transcriptional regulator n=1 Tax=Streptomyces sp. NPDC087440 TaxID=3365790 RepID=UPI0038000DC2